MTALPHDLVAALERRLGAPLQEIRAVGGGDISQAARLVAGDTPYLLKWRSHPPPTPPGWPAMFEAEAQGLERLASAGVLRVPAVLGFGGGENSPGYLLLEWIERGSGSLGRAGKLLGESLAALHRIAAPRYGLDRHNYCGATPQDNTPATSWIEFYGRRRLGFQMELAGRQGRMPRQRRQRLERLIDSLDRWIDEAQCRPSLLHGDLWGGNWLVDSARQPVLIDPAIYFGDREAELAMCRLFGGFPAEFYQAYDATWSPAPGRDERIPLYQLYHVLNHLNLFGEGYGGHVDSILRRYQG